MGEHRGGQWMRWIGIGALWAAGCTGGTDTGNPLTDLDISECKSEREQELSAKRSALTLPDVARFDGLNCYGAQRSGDMLELEVRNFNGGCHVSWDAHGRERGGELAVVLTNPSCSVAGCGSCLYDATFSLELGKSTDETIDLIDQPCESDPETLGSWQLPERDGATTLQCSFAKGVDWHAPKLGLCGQENMPCRSDGLCGDTGADACDVGLTCTELSEYDSRCLKQCSSDDDCAVPGALRCHDDGLCRP